MTQTNDVTPEVETPEPVDLDRLIETAVALGDQVMELQKKVGVAEAVGALETRTSDVEIQNKTTRKWATVAVVGVVLDIILTFAMGGLFVRSDNTIKDVKANAQEIAVLQKTSEQRAIKAENDLCELTIRSWDTRKSLAETLTKPTKLSPEVEKLFPSDQVESLRLQVESANRNRAKQRAELLAQNGPRPVCNKE